VTTSSEDDEYSLRYGMKGFFNNSLICSLSYPGTSSIIVSVWREPLFFSKRWGSNSSTFHDYVYCDEVFKGTTSNPWYHLW